MARPSLKRKLAIGVAALFVPPAALGVGIVLALRARGILSDPSILAAALVIGGLAMTAYLAFVAWGLGRTVIRSLRTIARGAELMATVNPDHRIAIATRDELEETAEYINQLADRWGASRRALAEEAARADQVVSAERAHLGAVLEHLDEGVVVVTGQGAVVLANRAAADLLGIEGSLLGRSVLELMPGEPLVSLLARVRAGEPVRERTTLQGPVGVIEARITSLVRDAGRVDGMILALRDAGGATSRRPLLKGMGLVSGESSAEPGPDRPLLYDFSYFERVSRTFHLETRDLRLGELTFAVLDTETTGLRPLAGDRVVSVAAVLLDAGRLRSQEAFDALVNPGRPIPAASTRFHGITDAMVADAPPAGEVLSRLRRFVGDAPLVGHEIAFDMEFLDIEARRSGLPPLSAGRLVLDTRLISNLVHGPGLSHSLEAVAERLGVTIQSRHSALGDALATADILKRLIELAARRGIETLGGLLDALRRRSPRA
jgi:DNA polymerase III subunit epsilon